MVCFNILLVCLFSLVVKKPSRVKLAKSGLGVNPSNAALVSFTRVKLANTGLGVNPSNTALVSFTRKYEVLLYGKWYIRK